jgi:nicotinamidase-related amidase
MFSLDPNQSALLVMDCQRPNVQGYVANGRAYLSKALSVITQARSVGMPVIFVRVGFRPDFPEVAERNAIFCGVRQGGMFVRGDSAFDIHDELSPMEQDIVIEKHRISAFEGTDLSMVLRAGRIETIAMFGIATSGVVLSTLCQAADLDYRVVVLEDLCVDGDAEVHRVLIEKVLPSQAAVITAAVFIDALQPNGESRVREAN